MRRKLTVLFTMVCWCLVAGNLLAAETAATTKAKPSPARVHPGRLDKGDPDMVPMLGCGDLLVYWSGTNPLTVSNVACDHGYYQGTLPSSGTFITSTTAQSSVYGPDCTFTVSGGSAVVVVEAQQNYCAFEAGAITVKVISGPAVVTKTLQGSYGQSLPGQAWVTIN